MPAEVSSQPDPDTPGLTGHLITGFSAEEVQAEINKLLWQFDRTPGEGHFRSPRRVRGRWYSSGWTKRGALS